MLLSFQLVESNDDASTFESNIFFEFYNERYGICGKIDSVKLRSSEFNFLFYFLNRNRNELQYTSNSFGDDIVNGSGCNPSENVAIIVHGWLESCETMWIQEMVACELYEYNFFLCFN